jgi:TusE/DsrC/DsvC family sulfur relay protein
MEPQLTDEEGYLIDPLKWNESVAEELARQENIQLTEIHWAVIGFMRKYYEEHLIAPDARYSIKYLSEKYGKESRNKLFELFPYGYVQQACKIAGMKRPRGWSTG